MEKLFQKFLNGTCTPQEFDKVIGMICDKNNNGILSTGLNNLWIESLNDDIPTKRNDQLLSRIHHQIALTEPEINHKRFILVKNLLKAAAVLIIGLLLSTITFYYRSISTIKKEVLQTITTPYGAKTNFKLPDGSYVWMNSGSILSYSLGDNKNREIKLSGQAFFYVSKEKRPFIVSTRYGTVEAKGTSFDVKAYDSDNFQTTLVEGIVDILTSSNDIIELKPGQQLIIDTINNVSINNVKTYLFTSWKDGKLIFVDEPFCKVAQELERWYNVKIEIQGEKLKNLKYTGKIEMETFSEVLDLINITTHIKYKFDKNSRVLIIYSIN